MLALLLFRGGGTNSGGGGITYPSPIFLMRRGTLAMHISGIEYLELEK